MSDVTHQGTVVRVVHQKGFGFIQGENKKDYFFHKDDFSGFFDDLAEDVMRGRVVKVTFIPFESSKGPRASQVIRNDNGV